MKILDYYIWDVIGLDVTESERLELEEGLAESAWYKFLSEDLRTLLSADDYKGLVDRFEGKTKSKEQFIYIIKQKLEAKGINFDEKMDESLEAVLKIFVADQIDYHEKSAAAVQDQTERTLKLSLIKNLRDLFSQELWDQMGEIFKKISGYSVQKPVTVNA